MARTSDEIIKDMENSCAVGDSEGCHLYADELLMEYLRAIGHDKMAETWEKCRDTVGFWYA